MVSLTTDIPDEALPVSIVMPVYQERAYVEGCIESLRPQIEAVGAELIAAEGGSTDGTREILDDLAARYDWLQVVDNPGAHPAVGLNRAISVARGSTILRADAHTYYASDYVLQSLTALSERMPAVVGGMMQPHGLSQFGQAVADAMRSPWAIGPARFHHADRAQRADTVYLGGYPTPLIHQLGGYRAFPSKAGEDADLYARIRRAGFDVWLDPRIRSHYRPRESLRGLGQQSWRYGQAKAEILLSTGRLPSWRPLGPMVLIPLLLSAFVNRSARVPRLAVLAWTASLLFASWRSSRRGQRARFLTAAAAMQLCYGSGMWVGIFRGRRRAQPLSGQEAGWAPLTSLPA